MELKKIQGRLKKLLALSASPNEAEAALAMEKCSELMEKYGIRTIDVDEETNETNIATAKVDGYTKKHRAWESKLAAIIADAFDAEAIIQRRTEGWNIMFIAGASERDIIVDLYKRLRRIISQKAKIYARCHSGHTISLQKSYAFGMIDTIYARLCVIYKDTPDTRALVLVKKGAIDSKVQDMFGKLKKNKAALPKDRQAFMQGLEDGKNVSLNRSVSGDTQQKVEATA